MLARPGASNEAAGEVALRDDLWHQAEDRVEVARVRVPALREGRLGLRWQAGGVVGEDPPADAGEAVPDETLHDRRAEARGELVVEVQPPVLRAVRPMGNCEERARGRHDAVEVGEVA